MRDRTGEAAEPFDLASVDGRRFTPRDFRGNWLLLVFHRHLA